MDVFDKISNEEIFEPKINLDDKSLLETKRSEMYNFFSSTKSLIVVIILAVGFIYNLYNTIQTWITSPYSLDIFSIALNILVLVFAGMIPYAMFRLYNSSKIKDVTGCNNGFDIAVKYFNILRVLIIIIGVLFGLLVLLAAEGIGSFIVAVLIFGAVFAFVFYMNKAFIDLFASLKAAFNSNKTLIPSTNKVSMFLIVSLILSIISLVISVISIQLLITNVDVLINYIQMLEAQLPTGQIIDPELLNPNLLVEGLRAMLNIIYIVMGVVVLAYGYLIYYLKSAEKRFTSFNKEFRRRLQLLKEQALQAAKEKQAEYINGE